MHACLKSLAGLFVVEQSNGKELLSKTGEIEIASFDSVWSAKKTEKCCVMRPLHTPSAPLAYIVAED